MSKFPYISRELEEPIKRGTKSARAELLLGPRQVGKTTLLSEIVNNQRSIKLTGEDEDVLQILSDSKAYVNV